MCFDGEILRRREDLVREGVVVADVIGGGEEETGQRSDCLAKVADGAIKLSVDENLVGVFDDTDGVIGLRKTVDFFVISDNGCRDWHS